MLDLRSLLSDRLASVRGRIADACRRVERNPTDVTLIAVTKTVSPAVAAVAAELGELDLGESRPQEIWKKAAIISGVRWHLIGHLQRNKLDRTVPLVDLVHSADSERILEALDAFGRKSGRPIRVLLEVNCSREENKGGFRPEEALLIGNRLRSLTGISVEGMMTMAAYCDDPRESRPVFSELRQLRDRLRIATELPLPHLSMGMSNDFEIAVEEGATHVRIGTTLFEGLADS